MSSSEEHGIRVDIAQMAAKFLENWKHYVFQSLLATVTIVVVLVLLTLENAVIVAAVGASTFIVFAMPRNITAKTRNLFGGHMIGLVSGSLCHCIPHGSSPAAIVVYGFAVGVSIFLMVVLDMEHPPAAGTALGTVIAGFSWSVGAAVVTTALVLAIVHRFCGRWIKDLV